MVSTNTKFSFHQYYGGYSLLIVINSSLFYFQFYIFWLIIIVNYSLFVEQTVLYKLNTSERSLMQT